MYETWRVARMYQHLPAPTLHRPLHITMAMRCCIVLFQQFWLYMTNSWPHLILQESAEIEAWDCHTQVHFSSGTWHTWLSEHPDGAVKFSPWWHWKVPFSTLLPNKHATLLMSLHMSARDILVVIPDPLVNSKRCHKDMLLHNSTTSTIQVIWVQSYEEIHGTAIRHKTLKWPVYLSLWMISYYYHSVASVLTLVDGTQFMMLVIYQFQDSLSVWKISKKLPSYAVQ